MSEGPADRHDPPDADGADPRGAAGPEGEEVTQPEETTDLRIALERFDRDGPGGEGYEAVTLVTDQGGIRTHYYAPARSFGADPSPGGPGAPRRPDAAAVAPGAVFIGGDGGGFDTPVRGRLYPDLCRDLSAAGVACLRVSYRRPGDFEHCVLDVLAALAFLDEQDVGPVALAGHSFGGAVAVHAALLSPVVVTCVPLSTMPNGAEGAEYLGPRCSILLAHGTADDVLPAEVSRRVYEIASEPKRLLLKEGAGHGLDEWADELPGILREWVAGELRRAWPGWDAT